VPARPLARFDGAVNVATGACPSLPGGLIVTVTAALVVLAALLSVARAVRVRVPVVAGVHVTP
jgi:hypothetical protein